MSRNDFVIVGKMGMNKGTDKFKPFEVTDNGKGWNSKKINFFVKNDLNYQNLTVRGGYSDKNKVVYTLVKDETTGKYKSEQIAWDKRLEKSNIEKVAEFKKFVIVMGKDLEGNDIRMEFIHEWDFIDNIKFICEDEQYKDKLWRVMGEVVTSEWKGKYYTNFVPSRIYLVDDTTEQVSEGVLEFHYGEGAIVDCFEDLKKIVLNGYTRQYDGSKKEDIGVPVKGLEIDFSNVAEDKREKIYKKYLEIFTVDGEEFKKIGLKVKYLKGTETVEFDESMLDEEQLENIELGLTTLEEVKAEMGVGKGNFTEVTKVAGLARGYSKGGVDTGMTLENYIPKDDVMEDLHEEEVVEDEDDDLDLLDLDL